MASNAKLSNPVAMRCETVVKEGSIAILVSIVNNEDIAILQATGTPINKKQMKLTTNRITGKYSIL
ncbi:hypothetical protein MHTCC0001_20750 [Flavobacteriaceae bacterium MHTCC 0001]